MATLRFRGAPIKHKLPGIAKPSFSRVLGCNPTLISGGGGGGGGAVLILDAARIANGQAMKAAWEANPTSTLAARMYGMIKIQADLTDAVGTAYANIGLAAAWMYQITGDITYAIKAYSAATSLTPSGWAAANSTNPASPGYGQDPIREVFIDHLVIYSWIRAGLSAGQKTAYWGAIQAISDFTMNIGTTTGGTRTADSDQTVAFWFGNAILEYWNIPENTNYGSGRLNGQVNVNNVPVGGIDASASNTTSTLRNAIKRYFEMASNSDWIESSEYNPGTTRFLVYGILALRSVRPGSVPEADSWMNAVGDIARWDGGGANWNVRDGWGDNEQPHQLTSAQVWRVAGRFAKSAVAAEGKANGQIAMQAFKNFEQFWNTGANAGTFDYEKNFIHKIILLLNPFAPASVAPYPWASSLAYTFSAGLGRVYAKRINDFLILATHPKNDWIDHCWIPFSDAKFYRNGEWVLDHPEGYTSFLTDAHRGWMHNTLLSAGNAIFSDAHITRYGGGTDWCYNWGECGDSYWLGSYGPGDYQPPEHHFLSHVCRKVFLTESGWDVIIFRDDVNIKDPRLLANYASYDPIDKTHHNNFFAVTNGCTKARLFHAPLASAVDQSNPNQLSWTTPGGQLVKIIHLKPSAPGRSIVNESVRVTDPTIPSNGVGELNYHHIMLWNTTVQDAETYIHVFVVGSSGTPPTITLLPGDNVQVGTRTVTFSASDVTVT